MEDKNKKVRRVVLEKINRKLDALSSFDKDFARKYGNLFLTIDELFWLRDTLVVLVEEGAD